MTTSSAMQDGDNSSLDRASQIAEDIRMKIVRGELRPGDALPITSALGTSYGASPPTMRAALRLLEAEGLLRVHRGARGGPRVEQLDTTALARQARLHLRLGGADLDDLYEALEVLQPRAVELAAARRTKQQIKALHTTVERVRSSSTMSEFTDASTDFVLLLMEASGNHAMKLFAVLIGDLVRQEIHREIDDRQLDGVPAYHASRFAEVVTMIELRQGDAAGALWRAHLMLARPSMRGLLGPSRGTA